MMRSGEATAARGMSPFAGMDAASLLAGRAAARPRHPLLVWAPADGPERVWTYAAFADEVARLAGGLAARGIRPGDRVLVHLENCPETLLARFACAWLGAICVASNAMASGPELAAKIEATGARAAITQPRLAATLAAHGHGLEWIAVTATDAGAAPDAAALPQHGDRYEALLGEPLPRRAPDPSLAALILFTTGTTARPKAVLWTHENLLWGAALGARQQGFRDDDVAHLFLPQFHVVGFSWTFLPILWAGGSALLQPRFSASRFWPAALRHGATISAQVPFTLGALEGRETPRDHRFRFWIVNRQLADTGTRFGVPRIVSAWGMTEMVSQPVVADPAEAPVPSGAIGRPSLGYTVRIADAEGREAPVGEPGELLIGGVRGRSIFREYFADARATADAFDEAGFFRTGDRVRRQEDGTIVFVDRIKDVIKVGGEGVSSVEIETAILQVPGVGEVAVVPRPDPMRGEVPVAFVVAEAGREADAALAGAIADHCRERLARFKVPQDIRFLDALPRVGFGKVAKGRLRELALEGSDPS